MAQTPNLTTEVADNGSYPGRKFDKRERKVLESAKDYVDTQIAGVEAGVEIGGAVTSGTTGAVLFIGPATVLAQDATNLFWDNTNSRLGLGTTTPGTKIELTGTGDTSPLLFGAAGSAIRFSDSAQITGSPGAIDIMPSRTLGNTGLRIIPYSALGTNDTFLQLFADAAAYGYIETYGGLGLAVGTGTLTPTLFTVNRVEKMRLSTDGNLGIGTTTPSAPLDVAGDTVRVRTARTPASATAAGNTGDIAWDSTYFYICVTGGAEGFAAWHRTLHATWV